MLFLNSLSPPSPFQALSLLRKVLRILIIKMYSILCSLQNNMTTYLALSGRVAK